MGHESHPSSARALGKPVKSGLVAAKARGKRLGRPPGHRPKSDRLVCVARERARGEEARRPSGTGRSKRTATGRPASRARSRARESCSPARSQLQDGNSTRYRRLCRDPACLNTAWSLLRPGSFAPASSGTRRSVTNSSVAVLPKISDSMLCAPDSRSRSANSNETASSLNAFVLTSGSSGITKWSNTFLNLDLGLLNSETNSSCTSALK